MEGGNVNAAYRLAAITGPDVLLAIADSPASPLRPGGRGHGAQQGGGETGHQPH